jgi:hypothetical protein
MKRSRYLIFLIFLSGMLAGCQLVSLIKPEPTSIPARDRPANPAVTDPSLVSLNNLPLKNPESGAFEFMVIAHIYGTTIGEDRDPSPTLLANLEDISRLNLTMLVSEGDMVKHAETEDFDILDSQVLEKLPFPVFNTVGNHDVDDRDLYVNRYGQTYFSFIVGSAQMVFLDTELSLCQIEDDQLAMFNNVLASALENDQIKTIFIFMHKTLFFKDEVIYKEQLTNVMPNQWVCYGNTNFSDILENSIKPASKIKPVYMFAGDVGAWGNLSPYYEKLQDFPMVEVNGDKVAMKLYPLTDSPMMDLESYTPAYWETVK